MTKRSAKLRNIWISASPAGMTLADWKPIARCAICAWIGLVLILVPRTLKVLGQASYLVIVVACVDPPTGPIVKVFYSSLYTVICAAFSWGIYAAASKAAVAARTHVYSAESLTIPNSQNFKCASTPAECFSTAIFDGQFIEGRSSLVYAFFLYFGIAFWLYMKVIRPARVFSIIFGMISLVIGCVYGPLFPYWYPQLGQTFFIPIAIQSAINLGCRIVFWPESMSHAYIKHTQKLIGLIQKTVIQQKEILGCDPRNTDEWRAHEAVKVQIRAARTSLAAFGPMEGLLIREFQYSRLGPDELRSITLGCRDILLKLGGFTLYYDLVTQMMKAWHDKMEAGIGTSTRPSTENTREKPSSEMPTRDPSLDSSPAGTPGAQNSALPSREDLTLEQRITESAARLQNGSKSKKHDKHHKHAHFKFPSSKALHEALHHHYKPTGVFEMHHYVEHEARFPSSSEVEFLVKIMAYASESTKDLLDSAYEALQACCQFLENVNNDRFAESVLLRKSSQSSSAVLGSAIARLTEALNDFHTVGRLKKLQPYDSLAGRNDGRNPHRPLVRMYYLEFTLVRFAETSLKLTERCVSLDAQCPEPRWHWPRAIGPWQFRQSKQKGQTQLPLNEDQFEEAVDENMSDDDDDDDPHQTEARDPDHGPARRWYHLVGRALVGCFSVLGNRSVYFALKAALLVILVSMPAFIRRSAGWFYHQRGLWAVIMATLTQTPFTGDTLFSFVFRIFGTFLGACFGCVLWYIGDGNGNGQPFGLGATMAVAFVILIYIRLKWLYVNPQPAMFLVLTNALIIGYSWQDTHLPSAVNLGSGFFVAWHRFVVVLIGISAAFVWTFLPKPKTGRQFIRRRLAAGAQEIGNIYVRVSNFARNPMRTKQEEEEIRQLVVRANTKLLIINTRLQFAAFEPPIQGPWPRDKYVTLLRLQGEILDLMVAFMNNLIYMKAEWVESMLRRSGWYDRELVGDCLAVIFMAANSIRTGSALPQTIPTPLIDRYYEKLDLFEASQSEHALPQIISRETMEDPGYASFAVGSVLTFAIIHRLDSMLLVTKELVGEVWHLSHFHPHPGYQRLDDV